MNFILSLLFLLPGSHVSAAVIEGRISSCNSGKPIAGVNVLLKSTYLGAASDKNGRYRMTNIPSGEYVIHVSHVTCSPQEIEISLDANDTMSVDFSLVTSAIQLEEFVYTATRTWQLLDDVPVATELISFSELQQNAAINAAEALESSTGLEVREDFSGKGITLQGVDPNKVLVLIDGNRVIGRINGSLDLGQISTSNIKQIEVVKGAVSTLYGSEAIGGVINIITRDPVYPFRLKLNLSGGGYAPGSNHDGTNLIGIKSDNFRPSGSLEWRKCRFGFLGSVSYNQTGLVDFSPENEHTNGIAANDNWNVDTRLTYEISENIRLLTTARYFKEKKEWVENSGKVSVDVNYDDREFNEKVDIVTGLEGSFEGIKSFSINAYRSEMNHEWKKLTRPNAKTRDFSRSNETYSQLSSQFTKNIGLKQQITFGGDYYISALSAASRMGEIPPDEFTSTISTFDLFVQDEYKIIPEVVLVPGIRYEYHEVYGNNFSPRFSLMWSALEMLKIRASMGQGYRAPSSKELKQTFNHSTAGYMVIGNENLDPEKSRNTSLSFEITRYDRSVTRISLFDNQMKDLIDFDLVEQNEEFDLGIYEYKNFASSWTRGFEIEHRQNVFDNLSINSSYNFLASRDNQTGTPLPRRSEHSVRWETLWEPQSWALRVWGKYTGRGYYGVVADKDGYEHDEWIPAFHVWNLSVSKYWGFGTSTYIRISNIENVTNSTFGYWTGRIAMAGVKWDSVF